MLKRTNLLLSQQLKKVEAKPATKPAASAASVAAAASKPTGGGNNRGGNSRYQPANRFNNRRRRKPKQSASQIAAQKQKMLVPLPKKIMIDETMTVSELAKALGREASEVLKKIIYAWCRCDNQPIIRKRCR